MDTTLKYKIDENANELRGIQFDFSTIRQYLFRGWNKVFSCFQKHTSAQSRTT